MKRMKIVASIEASDLFKETQDKIEDNFAYAVAGIEKLQRDGNEKLAIEVMQSLNSAIESAISSIAADVVE